MFLDDVRSDSPVLLRLWFALHGCEQSGCELTLFGHVQSGVTHLYVDYRKILQTHILLSERSTA